MRHQDGRQCSQAHRFDGLGLKTITRLLWAGKSPDKIETLKVSDGRVVGTRGYVEANQHSEAMRPSDEAVVVEFPVLQPCSL